jgi:RNA polymerase sigma-70 factor (ECF subfamily)
MKTLHNVFDLESCAGEAAALSPFAWRESPTQAAVEAERTARGEAHQSAAVERLIAAHGRMLYRVAYAVTRNAADAEDAVQETMLQLLRGNGERLAAIEDERSYLARSAWRAALRAGRRQRSTPQSSLDDLPAEPVAVAASPEQAAISGDLEGWLHGEIDRLPEKLRQALALAALGELSSVEIAAVLGTPEGTVRRRIHTARQMLRKRMAARAMKGGAR